MQEINPFTITQVLRELGPSADPKKLAERIKQIDLGLTPEDELQVILFWLGRCSVCHKLENVPFVSKGKAQVRVPDLLAVFDVVNSNFRTAIEVKTSRHSTLHWSAKYLESLLRYQEITGMPVLIAWKHPQLELWTLNDIAVFERTQHAYKLTLERAFKENLMGILAGDVCYQLMDGVGLHITFQKEKLIEKEVSSDTETWQARITDAYFTDGKGIKYTETPPGIFHLFLASPFVSNTEENSEMIFHSFVINSQSQTAGDIQFLHHVFPILLFFLDKNEDKIEWRNVSKKVSLPFNGEELKTYLETSIGVFTKYELLQRPQTLPKWLNLSKKE
jgi:Holliday junction resolvase